MLNSFSGVCLFSVHVQVDNAIDEKYVIDEKNGSSTYVCSVFSSSSPGSFDFKWLIMTMQKCVAYFSPSHIHYFPPTLNS